MRQFKPGQLQTGSIYPISASYALTASYVSGSVSIDTGSLVTTASFNAYTASQSLVSQSFNSRINSLTGSINTLTSSYNSFTSSYTTGSFTGSFMGTLIGTASWANNAVTASFITASNVVGTVTSASFAISASHTVTSSYAITASYAVAGGDQDLQRVTDRGFITTNPIYVVAHPYAETIIDNGYVLTQDYNNGSIAALFNDGTILLKPSSSTGAEVLIRSTNRLSSSYNLDLPNKPAGTYTIATTDELLKYNTTSSFNAFTASYTTGSFTGSFRGDGSQLTGIVSSKWTGSNPISRESDVEISGSLTVTGAGVNLETDSFIVHSPLVNVDLLTVSDKGVTILDTSDVGSIDAESRQLSDSSGNTTLHWESRQLYDSSGNLSIDWNARNLLNSSNITIVDWELGTFSGTSETASFVTASNVVGTVTSASYAESASYLIGGTGSFVTTASFNAFTASYTTGSFTGSFTGTLIGTASWATNSVTASFVTASNVYGIVASASYASTASYVSASNVVGTVTSASYSQTASYVLPLQQTLQLTGSLFISGSTTQIGTNNLLGQTNLSGSIQMSGSIYATANMSLGGVFRLDPAQDPGSTNETASFLFTSASNTTQGYDLYYRQDGNLVKFKWIEGGISSGLLYGGIISASGATIFVSSGSGVIINANATPNKEINPIFTYVTWPNYSASATYLTSSQNTYLYADNLGVIHQQTGWFDQTQYEQAIPLGRVTHPNFTTITGVGSNVQTTYDSDTQQSAFIRAFGPLKVSGFSIQPQTGTLSIGIGDGIAYTLGGFYSQNPNSPSHYHSNGFATASIARAYRSGSAVKLDNNNGAFYTTVDPNNWDDGTGVLNTMSAGDWQIQRVFTNPITGRTVVYYGQNTYTTLLNALQYLATDSFTEGEFTANSLIFVGYLVLKGQTNNLTDTANNRIINAGIFRNIAGGSAGGGAIAQTLDELGDVTITTPSNGQALVYSAGIWENGTPKNAETASFITAANVVGTVTSASYAVSASFLIGGVTIDTGSLVTTSSFNSFTSSIQGQADSLTAATSSYMLTSATASMLAPYVLTSQTASMSVLSASFAQTASFVTASNVIGTVVSASYALTASYAMNGGGGGSGTTYIRRSDYTTSIDPNVNYLYLGDAEDGSLESSPVWDISRLSISSSGATLTQTTSSAAWTDRYTVTYL